jgi:spore maturation protein CgeB
MKILCVGPIWRGSNAGGLFKALGRKGALIEIVDEFYHIPLESRSFKAKVISKLIRPIFIKEYNIEILEKCRVFVPDLILIYKGAFVLPETLKSLKKHNVPLVNFFPDVSFRSHGSYLPKTLPLYDHIFTTKTFGIYDLKEQLGINNSSFIAHGFDPEIHRQIDQKLIPLEFFCDVSFIGTYSPKKEKLLAKVRKSNSLINLKIWGEQWNKCTDPSLQDSIQGRQILGDLYSTAINGSKINLGFLSEQVQGASSGDLITSRTFHIPASGGFMLHERNEQSLSYYVENEEAGFFSDEYELVHQIEHFLKHSELRNKIAEKGKIRAINDHSLDQRAGVFLEIVNTYLV